MKPIDGLVDIAVPAAIPWTPQTWGWAALAIVLGVAIVVSLWRWRRHALANRYRKEALAVLATLERQAVDPLTRSAALVQIAALIKRTALAVFPRDEVAPLFGSRWVDFIRQQDQQVPVDALAFLDDLEYQRDANATIAEADAKAAVSAARAWIKGHRVPA